MTGHDCGGSEGIKDVAEMKCNEWMYGKALGINEVNVGNDTGKVCR